MANNTAHQITQEVAMTTLQQRVNEMIEALGVSQSEFGRLAGAARGLVSQWVLGQTLNMGAEFAAKLESNTGYKSRWIMFGLGDKKQDRRITRVAELMELMSDQDRDRILEIAERWTASSAEPEPDRPATAISRTSKSKKRRA